MLGFVVEKIGAEVGHRDAERAGEIARSPGQEMIRRLPAGSMPSGEGEFVAVDDLTRAEQHRRGRTVRTGHHICAVMAVNSVDVKASGRPVHDVGSCSARIRV